MCFNKYFKTIFNDSNFESEVDRYLKVPISSSLPNAASILSLKFKYRYPAYRSSKPASDACVRTLCEHA